MQKWEYLVVYIHDSKVAEDGSDVDNFLDADTYTDKLNIYGDAGWDVVELCHHGLGMCNLNIPIGCFTLWGVSSPLCHHQLSIQRKQVPSLHPHKC